LLTAHQIRNKVMIRYGLKPDPDVKIDVPDPVDWITTHFYLYDTANLISLYDCQRRPLELAMSRNPDGSYRYNTILWAWPKKSAKSSVIAAVADWVAEHRVNGSIKLVANDLKQADSRVGMYVRESIKIGQRNGLRSGIVVNPSGYKIRYPRGAIIECVAIDPTGEAGGNDDMIVYSELWGWKSKAHQRMWSEMTLSPNKWGNSQRWIDTYAGIKGESPILEQLYETGVKNGVKVWDDLEVYSNDAAKMLTVWVTKPMFPWQTPEYYDQERGQLTPSEFERMHRNQWADSSETFIPIQWWDACKVETLPDLRGRGVVMGLDAAAKDDCFAMVIVSKGVDDDTVAVRYSRIWTPEKGGQIDFSEIEDEIERLRHQFNIVEVAYDETQLVSMAQRLGYNLFWNAFNQGMDRLIADKRLYDMIRDRRINHMGDRDLADHMLNADRKPEDDKLRIIKRSHDKKIDAVIALSMAVDRIMYLNL